MSCESSFGLGFYNGRKPEKIFRVKAQKTVKGLA
jgi:hypothetical protein